jgi:asparagine synthase (glutamine-hydrolysing)
MRRGKPAQTSVAMLNPEFTRRMNLRERRRELMNGRIGPARCERESHYRILTGGVMQEALELLDPTAAAFSIEPRYPFWDRHLVEYCLSLPPEQKLCQGWTRMVLRRAMEGILPREIQWRGGKSNLGPGLEHGLLSYDRERLDSAVRQDLGIIEDYVNLPLVRQSYERFLTLKAQADDIMTVCHTAALSSWLKFTSLRP